MAIPLSLSEVPDVAPYKQYVAAQGQTTFGYPFPITQDSDLVVVINGVTQITDSTYSLTGQGNDTGGNVILATGSTAGDIITLYRDVPIERITQFSQNSGFSSAAFNAEFNNLYLIAQQLENSLSFALQIPTTNVPLPTTILTPAAYANKYLGFDQYGNPQPVALTASGAITSAIIGSLLYPRVQGEIDAAIIPTSQQYPTGNAVRYGVDTTGGADSTGPAQVWANASWQGLSYASPWDGSNGVNMVMTLPPGRVKVSGSITLPCNITLQGTARPGGYTESHTRVVMNSTGYAPARIWLANAVIPAGASIQATVGGTLYYFTTVAGGTSGSSTPAWSTGGSTADGTVTWVLGTINGGVCALTGDNRNTPMFNFSRATKLGGSVVADQYLNTTISNMEFWYVTPGGTFNAPFGAGMAFGDYPSGATLYFGVDTIDTRICDSVFQNTPCAILIKNVSGSGTRSDGLAAAATPTVNIWVENCEFDVAAAHIWAINSALDIVFQDCEFYGAIHKYQGCSGRVTYQNCRFFGGAYVDASDTGNTLSIIWSDGEVEQQNSMPYVGSFYGAVILSIDNITLSGSMGGSGFIASNCDVGGITNCKINDSGFNGASTTGLSATAAIKMIDCQGLKISGNNITTTDAATYAGFGILTLSSGRGSAKNFISDNCISGAYTGANYNGQNRRLNVATSADIIGINYDPNGWIVSKQAAVASTFSVAAFSSSITIDASTGNGGVITATSNISVAMNAPTNPSEGQLLTLVIRNTSGGNLGTWTWNAVFKISSSATPINGNSLAITFEYNGTNWVELYRGTGSTPN